MCFLSKDPAEVENIQGNNNTGTIYKETTTLVLSRVLF
jgi:hypothetical protein